MLVITRQFGMSAHLPLHVPSKADQPDLSRRAAWVLWTLVAELSTADGVTRWDAKRRSRRLVGGGKSCVESLISAYTRDLQGRPVRRKPQVALPVQCDIVGPTDH